MVPKAEDFAAAVNHLYLAAQQPEEWTGAMDAVRRLFDGSRACLLLVDAVSGYRSVPSLLDEEFDSSDAVDLAIKDELGRALLSIRQGEARSWREVMDVDAFRQRDLARLHFRPRDMDNGLTYVFRSSPTTRWLFDISRHWRQPDFSEAEKKLAHRLGPHLLGARKIAAAMRSAETGIPLAGAHFVVDAVGRTAGMNDAADSLLARPGSPLRHARGVLTAVSPPDAERLAVLVASCCVPLEHARSSPGGMMIAAASEDAPLEERLLVSVSPMPAQGWFTLPAQRCALVLARPLQTPSQAAVAELAAAIYGLSASHARLAAALTVGMSVRDAAEVLGLSYGTARVYLDQIFRKTATRRQPELVALLKTIEATQGTRAF